MDNFENKDYGDYFKALEKSHYSSQNTPQKRTVSTPKKTHSKSKGFKIQGALFLAALLVVVIIAVSVTAAVNGGKVKTEPEVSSQTGETAEDIKKESFVFPTGVPDVSAENDAACAIVINKTENKVIAARNAHKRAYPASTAKIMTVLVAAENITDWNDTFTMTTEITDPLFVQNASAAGFLNGEEIPLIDLLYGAILPSGADAAVGIAVKLAGSEEAFVEMMNRKVEELGLENTHFTNVVGLHNTENYSSAYDMAVIINEAMENEICRKVLSTYQHTTTKTPQNPDGILLSSTLFSYMYGTEPETATILGGKTGYVNESGYCIATFGQGKESGDEYIAVTLGNSSLWPAIYGQIGIYKDLAK